MGLDQEGITLFASGGGHTAYAIAIGERLVDKGYRGKLTYVVPRGDKWSIDRIRLRIRNVELIEITKPLNPLEPYTTLFKRLSNAFIDSLNNIFRESIIICTGSNHNLFPILLSRYLGGNTNIYCVEDVFRIWNRSRTIDIIYKTTRSTVFLQWVEQRKLYEVNGLYMGVVFEKPIYVSRDEGYILVTTGTIGNRYLFKLLYRSGLRNLLIQTGWVNPSLLTNNVLGWKAFRYEPDLDKLIANASLVIASPGITAINVAQAYRKPMIMVYNPDIVLGAGFDEIKFVADQMGVPFIDPRNMEPSYFKKLVEETLDSKPRLVRDGASHIADYLLSLLREL